MKQSWSCSRPRPAQKAEEARPRSVCPKARSATGKNYVGVSQVATATARGGEANRKLKQSVVDLSLDKVPLQDVSAKP